tara:strand:+ start:164 stop:292 length:129 start_codon:yes stop_codon:yes gene_type:complete
MISDVFDYKSAMKEKNFGIKRYKQFVYKGQIDEKGKRSGFGI